MPNHDLKQGQTRRGTAIQTEEDRKSLSLAEMLADPNYMPTANEAFDAVNFIAEEYNPINKDKISAKQPQVGTTIFDMAGINQVARALGATTPRIDNSFLGNLSENKPEQFYGEEQFDLNTFKGLINRGFITTKDGTPINIQSVPLATTRTRVENDPYYATYQEYLNNPQNFKTENLPQKLELLRNKELAAYKLGDRFEIETPYFAGLGFDPKLKKDLIPTSNPKVDFDANNSIQYYKMSVAEFNKLRDPGKKQEYLDLVKKFDPDKAKEYETRLLGGSGSPSALMTEGYFVDGDTVYIPVTTNLGPGEQAFVSNLRNIVADVNTSYGLSQALGALSFELIPGIGLFGGTFSKAGQAIKSGVAVVRGTAGRLAKFNLPKSVDPKKIEVDINGDLTSNTKKYLEEMKISKQIMDSMESDFRKDMFALKIRQQNDAGTFMSKTDDFSEIPPIPKTEEIVLKIEKGSLTKSQKVMNELSDDHYQNVLDAIVKNHAAPGGRLNAALRELGMEVTASNKSLLSIHKREALKRGLNSRFDATAEYTDDFLKTVPIKVINREQVGKKRKSLSFYENIDEGTTPVFSLVKEDGTLLPNTYNVTSPGQTSGHIIHVLNNPNYSKIFGDEAKLNKFLEYAREYPDMVTLGSNPKLMEKIADDLGYTVEELFRMKKGVDGKYTGRTRDSVFALSKIIAQNLPKYDVTPSKVKQFLSDFTVTADKGGGRTAADTSWKGLNTDQILYYINNADKMTMTRIVEKLGVSEYRLNNLRKVIEKAQKESPEAFEETIGAFERKIYEGVKAPRGVKREKITHSDVKMAGGSKDIIGDIKEVEANRIFIDPITGERKKGKAFEITINGKKEPLIPVQSTSSPKLHDQGAEMISSEYAMLYDKTMEANQGYNILFTRTGKLRATQTSTTTANMRQAPLERKIIRLMDERKALVREAETILEGSNSGMKYGYDKVSQNSILFPETDKTISQLLKENSEALKLVSEDMSELGVRTLVKINLPDGTYRVTQFGDLLTGISDFIKKRRDTKIKDGGRVRDKFQTPGLVGQSQEERFMASLIESGALLPGSIEYSVDQATKNVQRDIQDMYAMNLREKTDRAIETIKLQRQDIEETLADKLNPPRPVKFKFSELPRLVTQGPIVQALTTDPKVAGLETIEFIYNSLRSGVENDIEMEEKFPKLYKLNELTKVKGPGPTPDEQDYISAIDEFNRAADTGLTNFSYNVLDLVFSIPDAVLPTEFTEELKRRYEESDMAKPETFVGQIASVAVEFGIPGGIVFKLINRFRKAVLARTQGKTNLFTQKTYGLEGLPKIGVQISNVAKRVGTGAVSFGAADFIAGGPYNTLTEMFDDPLLSSKLVGEYQNTTELSGKERVAANFKNRLRFGAEGAMIGGVFPLVGPALGAIGKNVLLKPALFLGGGALKVANVVAIKPATYLASLDPVVLPGLAKGVGVFGEFLGKDVLARLAATAATGGKAFIPSLKGNMGQLPEFSKWRMFDVTSNDPLEAGLKRVDNFLKWFREAGNQTLYAFNLSGGAERFIKSKAREIEKYIDALEKRAYDLANGFLGRYNKGFTSPAGERHMLEQIYEYLRGNLKLAKIEPELRELAKALKDEFDQIRNAYFRELPDGSGLKAALETNLDKYMRMSFATFTNPNYIPNQAVINDAVTFMTEVITKNEDFLEAAIKGVPVSEQAAAIREFARANVDNIIAIGKREGIDPLNALNQINKEILRGDEVFLQTGEELPKVIRNLLGQEKNLRASVMSTTGSLVSQTANIRAFKEFARHGLENGYLFTSRAEALAAGVTDPGQIRNLPGLGQMQDLATVDKGGPVGLFASNELKRTIENTGGMLDSLLQNSFYQSLIAYKAAVQTGKTVFSPATQTRNFGSAGFFPMHVGHIGGNSSVTDAFKIIMDDIFGAGRTVNEVDLIKRIQRKVELGVLDENIVASELGAILKDIKAGKLQSIGKLAERAENTKFYKQATRVYAGGDNVWKWYGHEYYMSQLKGAFKSIDDVKRFFEDIHGIEYNVNNIMTGARKTVDEGIEEAAAFLLRETYPTYSKVPEFIKAIRKLPIGNFVSFTSEILRTGFSTSAIAMKHIASDNRALREMGYRMLSGQAITLGGMTAGVTGLGHALTNVTPTQIEVYKEFFAPEYMKYSTLIPVSNVDKGTFKVFDFSRYNPYDIIVASSKQLLKIADRKNYSKELAQLKEQHSQLNPDSEEAAELRRRMKEVKIKLSFGQTLDPEKIQTDTLKQYLSYVGPLYDSVTGTFFGIPIGAEAFLEAASGRTRQGSPIWSKGMTDTEIFDRAMGHFFKTIEPGIISSGRKLFHSLRSDVSGVGQPLEINTEVFKLMGGSNVTVDIMGSLDFKISGFQQSFREARVAKDFFSTENFQSRGPEQLVREYNEQNEQAFRAQYEFYKAAMAAIDSGLLTRTEILKALGKRLAPGSDGIPTKAIMLMNGFYTPLSYGPEGLKSRRQKILRNNPDLDQRIYNYQYFFPLGMLEAEKRRWKGIRFQDMERELKQPDQQSAAPVETPQAAPIEEPQVAELPTTPDPVVGAQAPNVNPATGLTTTETALLSPGEQAIRQRQKGIA